MSELILFDVREATLLRVSTNNCEISKLLATDERKK